MSQVDLLGHKINLKTTNCIKNHSCNLYPVTDAYINLYIRIQNQCIASCEFCEYRGVEQPFDLFKLYYVLEQIQKKVRINKVSFTGGEPTFNVERLNATLQKIKQIDPRIFTVVNTNGYDWDNLEDKFVDSIALSRHHYNDEINAQIFKTNPIFLPTAEDIKAFKDKKKIHLSCNLIKGHIDNGEEVAKYMDEAAKLGVTDVGFVTLMEVNDFCKANQVDFEFLTLEPYGIFKNKEWKDRDVCRCENYLYIPKDSDSIVKAYSRFYVNQGPAESRLVYDGEYLRDGFGGNIIY